MVRLTRHPANGSRPRPRGGIPRDVPTALRALRPDARRCLLISLGRGQLTAAALGQKCHLSASMVRRHLERLAKIGLVRRQRADHHYLYELGFSVRVVFASGKVVLHVKTRNGDWFTITTKAT